MATDMSDHAAKRVEFAPVADSRPSLGVCCAVWGLRCCTEARYSSGMALFSQEWKLV